jgi:hypothetical protein
MLKRITLLTLTLVTLALPCYAQTAGSALNTGNVNNAVVKSFDGEQITVAATAIGFTSSKINPTCASCIPGQSKANVATCVSSTAQIRVFSYGTSPTSTTGLPIEAGTSFTVYGVNDVANFRAIRTGSTSAVLDCQYSRLP